MPLLTDEQLEGLSSANLGAGTELINDWDANPDAPCWGWALMGGPGGHQDYTPPVIFEQALLVNDAGNVVGVNPDFQAWVAGQFPNNVIAIAQAQIIADNFNEAWMDEELQLVVRTAFAQLCIAVSPLVAAGEPTDYQIIMASDNWYSWEHWALGLANNIDAPANQAMQYTQRDTVNPVNTRSANVWGGHPLLTVIPVQELLQGHIDSLQHAVGWPH
jgi:hypothetical protein